MADSDTFAELRRQLEAAKQEAMRLGVWSMAAALCDDLDELDFLEAVERAEQR